jgi:type I restriction enzyme S subunit
MKTRYSKYKPSGIEWVGEIPDHWIIKKIKLLFNEKRSVQNLSLSSGSISFGKVIFKDDEGIPETRKETYQEVLKGEFLINPLNLNYDLKSLRISKSEIDVVVSPGYIVLVLNNSNNKDYFKFLLHLFDVQHMKSLGNGIRQTISFKHISNEELILPPLPEQEQIVKYLDEKTGEIDNLISITENKIELLKENRTSTINRVITKGLDTNVELKDSGVEWIGEIPKHWVVKKMKYFVKICNGSDYKDHVLEEGGYPVYGTGGEFSRSSKFLYDKISVLLGRKGSVDKPQIVKEPFWTSDTTYYTEIKPNVSPYYFFFLVKQIPFELYIYGSAIPSMTKSVYDEMLFPYPPFHEQEEIVKYLDDITQDIDNLISIEQQRIETLKEYRQSLISEVITGKVRVCENDNF